MTQSLQAMKAMILAVQVIEMVQGAPQGLTRRLPTKVICEDRCLASGIAAPFTLPPPITAHQSPLPTQSAERLQKQKEIERPKRTWSLMLRTAMAMTMSRPPSPSVRVKRLAFPR